MNKLMTPRSNTSSFCWWSCSKVLSMLASLMAGILSPSRFLYYWSRAWASIRLSIPDFNIRSRHILRSRLRVITFMAVSAFSMNQQPVRKSCRMAQSFAIPPPMLLVMAEISSSWWIRASMCTSAVLCVTHVARNGIAVGDA